MSLEDLRAHRAHTFGEHYNWCGYCWLEGEANAGECACTEHQECIHHRRATPSHHAVEHPADGTWSPAVGSGGEYAEESAYHNPFQLVGAIGDMGSGEDVARRIRGMPMQEYIAYRRFWLDMMISESIRRPIDLLTPVLRFIPFGDPVGEDD